MKRSIISTIVILFFSIIILSAARLAAQDTASTGDVIFTPLQPVRTVPQAVVNKNKAQSIPALGKHLEQQTLWAIFITGLLGGFAAILMPCIFPMLPMTVSYFTKGVNNTSRGIGKATIYGISIITIYVVLGLLITVCFGADALNSLSTNGIFNIFFFLLLVGFAASFLGAFEITLPSKWINKMDQQSERKGLLGIFFMAATLSLISFSCTGPIIGTLLVQAATTGALLGPAIGMFGFSLALALPFTFFAMFPGWMNALPKSGGWLNSVKVTLGFLELALALKFLSNVDLAYHWHLFDREIFLALWIVIFGLTGLYLLGKLKFGHDNDLSHLSVPRLFLAIVTFSFTVYLVPGLWGAPLKSVSAFLPPMATQDFDLTPAVNENQGVNKAIQTHKYSDLFDAPKGFRPFFDYDEGIAYAKKNHKPVMIDFTGHACVNCRKMEANVWPDIQVSKLINQEYVLIQLYVDDKTDLQAREQIITPEGRGIKTIGNKWSYLQTSKFKTNSQPFYVLLNPDTEQPLLLPQGADYDALQYGRYLQNGLDAFRK